MLCYSPELMRIACKVVWYDAPDRTLAHLPTFLAHLMVYGSAADVAAAERYIPEEEFRRALQNAPAGVFTRDAWTKWHVRFGILPIPALPRRQFPDGSMGPEPGGFFGR